jgi:hypothetical protein
MCAGVGSIRIDPVEKLVGRPLVDVLRPRMNGPKTTRPGKKKNHQVDVYPLAFHEGDTAVIPLGVFGEIGISNAQGQLQLTVPVQAGQELLDRLAPFLVGSPTLEWSRGKPPVRVQKLILRMVSGASASYSIGALGEIGLEIP